MSFICRRFSLSQFMEHWICPWLLLRTFETSSFFCSTNTSEVPCRTLVKPVQRYLLLFSEALRDGVKLHQRLPIIPLWGKIGGRRNYYPNELKSYRFLEVTIKVEVPYKDAKPQQSSYYYKFKSLENIPFVFLLYQFLKIL